MLRALLALLVPVAALAGAPTTLILQNLDQYPKQQGRPSAPLVEARDGRTYSIFQEPAGPGGLARLTRGGELKVLKRFSKVLGTNPSGLVAGEDGAVYGSCREGGEHNGGTLWKYDSIAGTFNKLQDFLLPGGQPVVQCIGSDGALYGTYANGLFRSSLRGDVAEYSAGLMLLSPNCLVPGRNNVLYGTTAVGRENEYGEFFSVIDTVATFLSAFNATTGPAPRKIVEAAGSESVTAFYGISWGETEAHLLEISLAANVQAKVRVNFGPGSGRPGTSAPPAGDIVVGTDGALYIFVPGESADRIVRFEPQTGTTTTTVYQFTGKIENGPNLLFDLDGDIYGGAVLPGLEKPAAFRLIDIRATPGNHPPVARNDFKVIPSTDDTPVVLRPLANDFDVDGDPIEIIAVDPDDVEISDNGRRLTYTTTAGTVRDTITYTVAEVGNPAAAATATISLATQAASREFASLVDFFGQRNAYLKVRITPSRALSGVLKVAGRRFALKGILDEATNNYAFTTNTEFLLFNPPLPPPPPPTPTATGATSQSIIRGEDETEEEPEEEDPVWIVASGLLTLTIVQDPEDSATEATATLNFVNALPSGPPSNGTATMPVSGVPADGADRYTLVLPGFDLDPDVTTAGLPPTIESTSEPTRRPASLNGNGWALMTVTKSGSAVVIGRLADGRKFSFSGPFGGTAALPFYSFTNKNVRLLDTPAGTTLPLPRGILAGDLTFGSGTAATATRGEAENKVDFSGVLVWNRTGTPRGPYKSFGFSVNQVVQGYAYKPVPEGAAPIEFLATNRKRLVKAQLGPIGPLDDVNVEGSADSEGFFLPELATQLEVDTATGLVRGGVTHPVTKARYFTSGVIVQGLNQAVGMYETRSGTGTFVVKEK